jgi:hypothetical protein
MNLLSAGSRLQICLVKDCIKAIAASERQKNLTFKDRLTLNTCNNSICFPSAPYQ